MLEKCPSQEALQRLHDNPASRWQSGWEVAPAEGTAWQRITSAPFFTPRVQAGFTVEPDDRIFAIGSCFAREVEGALSRLGFAVDSLTNAFEGIDTYGTRHPVGFLNKYNAESIYQELEWALNPATTFPSGALQELPDGRWRDVMADAVFGDGDLDRTLDLHSRLTDVMRRVAGCRIVVITLGLAEVFFDTWSGLFTNKTPHLSASPGRYEFGVLTYLEVMDALDRVYRVLSEFGHPKLEILVTVSPVPLEATFTGMDVVTANTYSKAVLRAAATEWTQRHINVHYFPSYEVVMNSARDRAWFMDGRHVRHEMVAHVMQIFADAYAPQRAQAALPSTAEGSEATRS
jgi:GSCFA family